MASLSTLGTTHSRPTVAASADGTRVTIPAGVRLDEPIVLDRDLLHGGTSADTHVSLGAGARVEIVERLHGGVEGDNYTLGSTLELGANTELTYTVVQTAPAGVRIAATRRAQVASGARLVWNLALLGAAETTASAVAELLGAGAVAELAALFFPVGREAIELTTEVRHDHADTASQTVVRSIAAERGRGRYFGNIHIAAHAYGSEASLRDDTLLIGSQAKIDAIPALEIAANDVKAFHGATVGAMDDEHVFYLMSRGIERGAAERLIALGFFEPALARFPGTELRDGVRALLEAKLAGVRR